MKFANNLAIPIDTSNEAYVAAALRYQDFSLGIMNNPLFLGIRSPDPVLNTSGIPIDSLTDAQLALIQSKINFFSFDPYSAGMHPHPLKVSTPMPRTTNPLWPTCVGPATSTRTAG